MALRRGFCIDKLLGVKCIFICKLLGGKTMPSLAKKNKAKKKKHEEKTGK
jgi:hypothetical protein